MVSMWGKLLHIMIISLLYLMYRTVNTPDFTFNTIVCLVFIWFLKNHEKRA